MHHQSKRKRIHEKHEPFPHPEKWKAFLDKLILVVAVAAPILTLPQVYKIWVEQTVIGVSLTTWASYFVFTIIWLMYGFVHKDKPILVSGILNFFVQLAIVIGIIMYS